MLLISKMEKLIHLEMDISRGKLDMSQFLIFLKSNSFICKLNINLAISQSSGDGSSFHID